MMGFDVSIVIPAYNAERFLPETLCSVLSQSYKAAEVIVVDDGSTDRTSSVLEYHPNVHYHRQSNRGPAAARNTGLALATGEIVAFLDADDLWHPEMLRRCVDILVGRPEIGAVHANWLPVDENGDCVAEKSGWQAWRGDIFERLLVHIPFNTSSVVWRRAYWNQIGGFDETPEMNDDWLNWLRIVRSGCRFEAIDEPLVFRRVHSGSITHLQAERILRWRINALNRICAEFELPEALRNRAYGEIYWLATVTALRNERSDEARIQFRRAARRNWDLLRMRSTYYAIACHGESFSPEEIDLKVAEQSIQSFLDALFLSSDRDCELDKLEGEARATALMSLAQMAYAMQPTAGIQARRFAVQAVLKMPRLLVQGSALPWLLRILIGGNVLKTVSRITGRK